MRIHAVHTCPLWEHPDGWREPGIAYSPANLPVVGWVNVMDAEIHGQRVLLLLTNDAAR